MELCAIKSKYLHDQSSSIFLAVENRNALFPGRRNVEEFVVKVYSVENPQLHEYCVVKTSDNNIGPLAAAMNPRILEKLRVNTGQSVRVQPTRLGFAKKLKYLTIVGDQAINPERAGRLLQKIELVARDMRYSIVDT